VQTGQGGEWVIIFSVSLYTQHPSSSSSEGGVRAFDIRVGSGLHIIRGTVFLRLMGRALTGIWAISREYLVWNGKVTEYQG